MNMLNEAAEQLGITLDDGQLLSFRRYHELLLEANKRVNLTRITGEREVAIQHFLDSLTCLLVLPHLRAGPSAAAPRSSASLTPYPSRLIDVGSGAGFPALPLKIVRADLRVTLLESVGKKTAFLEQVVADLAMSSVTVIHGRAEDVAHDQAHREAYDIALARAVAPLPTLVELCLPFVKPGGRMIAQKTAGAAVELQDAAQAIAVLGGKMAETRSVTLPGLEIPRLLIVIEKRRRTPERYPRKAGLPAKEPIGRTG